MTVTQAMRICNDFSELTDPNEEQCFAYTEALEFLIHETKDPRAMTALGGYYYGIRRFDLAAKYYELAAEYDDRSAIVGLGYIWYYGRLGTPDYEKAFYYYSRAAKLGDIVCEYKVADMYKNGYFVEKDYEKYKSIIEGLYPRVRKLYSVGAPVPEIFTRLAAIRAEEGQTDEAVRLYERAKEVLAQRIAYSDFFGNLSIMKYLIRDLYRLTEFPHDSFDLFDLYELLKTPVRVEFEYHGTHTVFSEQDEEGLAVCFDGKWYRTIDDFFGKAAVEGKRLTTLFDELYDFREVEPCQT